MLEKREVRLLACSFSMTPRRAHCGRPWCYQATTIKQDFTQRWLAYFVLSRYSSAIVLSVRFSVMFTSIQHDLLLLHFQKYSVASDCTASYLLSHYIQKKEMHPSQFATVETEKKATLISISFSYGHDGYVDSHVQCSPNMQYISQIEIHCVTSLLLSFIVIHQSRPVGQECLVAQTIKNC